MAGNNDTEHPLVSIVVPIYNAEKTLELCLNSILAQTVSYYEIVLIDDGSTDRSAEICHGYKEKNKDRIRYIRQENSGPASARNKGIDNSKGKYIGFVDADDVVAPDMIQVMTEAAEQNHVDMVICSYWVKDGQEEEAVTYTLPEGLYEGLDYKSVPLSLIGETDGDVPPYSWVRLTRRNVFEKTGFRFHDGLVRSEDYHFWTKIQFSINNVYLLSQTPLYYYVENKTSITHTHVDKYWNGVQYIYNDLINSISYDSEIKQKLDIMLVKRSLIALNNATFNTSSLLAWNEINEIVNDSQLNDVISGLKMSNTRHFHSYRKLMTSHGKWLVKCKYMLRQYKTKLIFRTKR